MARPLHAVTTEALELDAADRLRLAAELIDSVEGAEDPGWAEAERTGDRGRSWDDIRADLLRDLASR